jgi:hypothetical protein
MTIYNTYRGIFVPLACIYFVIYTWRLVVVFIAKRERVIQASVGGSLSGSRFASLFDDQLRSLITGCIGAALQIFLASDPFGNDSFFLSMYPLY